MDRDQWATTHWDYAVQSVDKHIDQRQNGASMRVFSYD